MILDNEFNACCSSCSSVGGWQGQCVLNTPTDCRSFCLWLQGHWTTVKNAETGETEREKQGERELSNGPPTPSELSRGSVPPFWGINGKWIQRLLCFTCCKVTPKNTKLLSNSCSSLNYLTRYYIILTGCAPDSTWLPASLLSVCLLSFFFSTAHRCKHFLRFFLQPLCGSLHDGHHVCPLLLTVCQSKVDRLSFIYATAHLMYATWGTDGRV